MPNTYYYWGAVHMSDFMTGPFSILSATITNCMKKKTIIKYIFDTHIPSSNTDYAPVNVEKIFCPHTHDRRGPINVN